MNNPELYIRAHLARAHDVLGEPEAAARHYGEAAMLAAELLGRPAVAGGESERVLYDHAAFCSRLNLGADAATISSRLVTLADGLPTDSMRRTDIDVVRIQYLMAEESFEAMQEAFRTYIDKVASEEGLRTDNVQSLYASFAQAMWDADHRPEAFAIMRERLLDLDYWYLDLIPPDMPEAERAAEKSINAHCAHLDALAQKNTETCQRLYDEASAAYSAGDQETALQLHVEAAELGWLESQFVAGTFYQVGIGTQVELEKARDFYLWASRRGHMVAPHYLSALLQYGMGGDVDFDGALYWYYKSTERGYEPAFTNLYSLYLTTRTGISNRSAIATAIEVMIRAAEIGSEATFDTAMEYFHLPVASLMRA